MLRSRRARVSPASTSFIVCFVWDSFLSLLKLSGQLHMTMKKKIPRWHANLPPWIYGIVFLLVNVQCVSQSVSSVTQSCPSLCNPMSRSTPGLPIHHQLLEFTQTHIHRVSDAIQPSPAPNPSQHQGLFQWVNSSHEVAKVLEFQL